MVYNRLGGIVLAKLLANPRQLGHHRRSPGIVLEQGHHRFAQAVGRDRLLQQLVDQRGVFAQQVGQPQVIGKPEAIKNL